MEILPEFNQDFAQLPAAPVRYTVNYQIILIVKVKVRDPSELYCLLTTCTVDGLFSPSGILNCKKSWLNLHL